MKKILHIANDDKFVPLGKLIFDSVPDITNDYWIFPAVKEIEYCLFDCRNIHALDLGDDKTIAEINGYDLLCIEFLNVQCYKILNHKLLDVPILWMGWGGDYYWLIETSTTFRMYLPKTYQALYHVPYNRMAIGLINYLKKMKRASLYNAVQKIQYFAPSLPIDYTFIKQNNLNFKPQHIDINYGYINKKVAAHYSNMLIHGSKIMIGNSATPTNNHLDVLDDLKAILKGKEIVVPLSYGDIKYRDKIKKYLATNYDITHVKIIEEYLDTEKFDQLLTSCNSLIIGSLRQQSIATILKCMFIGIKIFLYQDSVNYKFFTSYGFHVEAIENLEKNPSLLQGTLSHSMIAENRRKISEFWSVEKNVKQIEMLLNKI